MCGIVFSAHWPRDADVSDNRHAAVLNELVQRLQTANTARGPDAQQTRRISVGDAELGFFASELRLRGDEPVVQPHVHAESGDIFCWNGEVFEGLNGVDLHENDGVKLFAAIVGIGDVLQLPDLLATVEGPYAFVYYHHISRRVFFARDPLGRRSLLIHRPSAGNPYFLLTSVSAGPHVGYDLSEVDTECIHMLDVQHLDMHDPVGKFAGCLHRLPRLSSAMASVDAPFAAPATINRTLPSSDPEPPMLESLDSIPSHLSSAVDSLFAHLDQSVSQQVCNIPPVLPRSGSRAARVAVLFSGGIDSTMLAFLAHRHAPLDEPIDLLNVAFENPRKIRVQLEGNVGGMTKKEKKTRARKEAAGETVEGSYDHDYLVPDRVTGLREVEELRRLCPGRLWNFVEIDVPYSESQGARSAVESLMWPRHTIMDLSLAMALYFASRGVGQFRSDPDAEPEAFTSHARVLLNGLGSDELLGGYGRHRTAYNTGGWQAVIDELQLEIDRIPTRNLGRDDRMIAAHGKETRHPFLALGVVRFLAELPVHHKLDPRLGVGVGDKTLLRLAARKVGLVEASARKKRAMQFGSHSARMENGVDRGSGGLDISEMTACA
ncbi:hypothetical protein FA95DRAFT_1588690 [Auriscalpium vulgare]|uniref:Uncharacterized protein n=1 Tax=Auriscalpium vulgare TaxID=40419 RepID=A0ACB8RVZ5_9AGAM|nr:hypothetical protein FA95DRAFT_1588690 [Auriscalpium vulgare]